ncbi:MAG: hypothetical protein EOM26_04435 [Alphaproteobacteria bacterium]|nr:hypothetical protein [Alphaproteobacteria bacterium]
MSAVRSLTGYAAFARVAFRNHIRNRVRFVVRFAGALFFCLVFIELWRLIAREGIIDIPWEPVNLFWYVSIAQFMLFLSPRLIAVIEDDVRTGNIACFLTRPLPYLMTRLFEGIGAMSANAAVYIPLSALILYLYIGEWPTHPLALPVAYALIYCASIIHLLFQTCAGLTALWLQDADMIYITYMKAFILLGGLYLPLSLYPPLAQSIALHTPFSAMLYFPCSVLLSFDTATVLRALAGLAGWGAFAALLVFGVFQFCRRRIEINGG